MKSRALEILLIILLADILLVAVSFAPAFTLPFIQVSAKFPYITGNTLLVKLPSFNKISDFSYAGNSEKTDSLISAYINCDSLTGDRIARRRSLTGLSPKIKNNFLYNNEDGGEYALDNFFSALLKEKDASVVRVAHYGDSQLEGDRISCYVRSFFQKKFGGSGVGFVPFEDIADNMNLSRISSPNWIRYTVFHNRYGCGFYGLSGNVYKFSKYAVIKVKSDSANADKKDTSEAKPKLNVQKVFNNATVSIILRPSVYYSQAYLMYGRSAGGCLMNVYDLANKNKLLSETLDSATGFVKHKLKLPAAVRSFKLEFSGDVSPDFYGLLLDGASGIQIDNYAIRGHSGDGLMLINPGYLATQLKKMNVKLVIFQYGNNVVPYVKSNKACGQMEKMYSGIFERFKNAAPGISILVIGAGDMAAMTDGEYGSYSFIPKIKEAQKNAALKNGCAFWDLFEVMGGVNSVLSWKKQGLASHDGHFSAKGQKIIGKELFNALMIEYNQYKFRLRKKTNSSEKDSGSLIK